MPWHARGHRRQVSELQTSRAIAGIRKTGEAGLRKEGPGEGIASCDWAPRFARPLDREAVDSEPCPSGHQWCRTVLPDDTSTTLGC